LQSPTGVPVFMYHAVARRWFEDDLAHLRRNGYQTVTLDQLVAWLKDATVRLPERPVAITLDDGHESVYRVAWPLLKEFGFRATLFVCPWWIPQRERQYAAVREHRFGCCATWDQLREMDASGVVDVQCHTYAHHRIWVGPVVQGFRQPVGRDLYIHWRDDLSPDDDPEPPPGWPLLSYASRFGFRRRFIPESEPLLRCADFVASNGGTRFFNRPDWLQVLSRLLDARGRPEVPGSWETQEQQTDAIRHDLSQAKAEIERRLGKTVSHLAFPWNEASLLATNIAAELGFRSVCRGVVGDSDVCRPGNDPMAIPRVPSGDHWQFVRALGGGGRRGPVTMTLATAAWRLSTWKRRHATTEGRMGPAPPRDSR
jgi:peptidoglycan/xylan/chitin deacetylase (PgdA/CDA1 family)